MPSYVLLYHPEVIKNDISKLNQNIRKRIQKAIEERLLQNPMNFGAPLRKSLKGYRKLRVGDYRVIYELVQNQIRIYTIGHRKELYESHLRDWEN